MSSIYIKTNYQPFFFRICNSVFLFFLILGVGYNQIFIFFIFWESSGGCFYMCILIFFNSLIRSLFFLPLCHLITFILSLCSISLWSFYLRQFYILISQSKRVPLFKICFNDIKQLTWPHKNNSLRNISTLMFEMIYCTSELYHFSIL